MVDGAGALTAALVGARARVPRHALRRAHARRARRADHVRAEAGGLRVRERAQRRPAASAPSRRSRSASSRARSAPTRRSTPRSSAARSSELGPRAPSRVSTQVVPRDRHAELLTRDRARRRLARAARDRDPPPPAHRGARGRGAVPRGPEGLERDAAQAQPDHLRADHAASRGCCAATRRPASRTSRSGTSATSRTPRSSGSCCRTRPPCSTTCSTSRCGSSDGMRVHPDRMRENLELTHGALFSQSVLSALVEAGPAARRRLPDRPARRAARLGRAAARSASCSSRSPRSPSGWTPEQLDELFDYGRFLRNVPDVFERLDELVARMTGAPSEPVRAVSIGSVPETAAELRRSDPPQPGQGPRDVRPRRPPADGRLGPHLRLRRRAARPPIPDKGKVLTGLSVFWFERTGGHRAQPPALDRRAGRGRAAARWWCGSSRSSRSSAWCAATCPARAGRSTSASGSVCGIELPAGLRESDRLPEPIFTPATKAELGEHDENIDFDRAAEIVGDRGLMEELRRLSLELYARGAEHAERNGHHPRRHQVRVRARRATARSCSPTRC